MRAIIIVLKGLMIMITIINKDYTIKKRYGYHSGNRIQIIVKV